MSKRPLAAAVGRSALLFASRRFIIMGLLAVGTALVARFLGPDEFGQLAATGAVFGLATAAADFGFALLLGRELAPDDADRGRVLRAGIQAQTAWSLLVTAVVVVIAVASGLDTVRGQAILVLAPAVAISGLLGTRQVFLVLYRTERLAVIDVATNVAYVAAMVAVAAAGGGVVGVAVTMAAGTILNTLLVAFAAFRLVDDGRPDRTLRRRLMRGALPLGVASFLSSAYTMIDLVLLGWLVTGAALGEYAAAVKLFSLMCVLPGLVMTAALPGLTSAGRDRAELSALVARVWHWLAAAALPLCVAVAVFADPIVHIVFGSDYEDAVPLVRIFAIAGALSMLAVTLDTLMAAERMGRQLVKKNVAALVVNVAGNLTLVPLYGVTASAWVTVATEVVVCAVGLYMLRGRLSITPAVRMTPGPLVAAGTAAAVALVLVEWPFVAAPVFVLVFLGLLAALGSWPEELRPPRLAAPSSG